MSSIKVQSNGLDVYVCPARKGKLEFSENTLRCTICQLMYPRLGGISDFLPEDREQPLGQFRGAMTELIVRLYETPLWYVPILKLAGGKGAPSYGEVIRQMASLMDVREGMLMDVACGPGTWGRRLASPSMEVYGIDISWPMLRQGVRVAGRKRIDAIHFAHATVDALPFGGRQFDAAYCGGALHGFPDTVHALREIGRTLKPGAPLVVLTFLDRDQPFMRMRSRAEARNDKLMKLHFFQVPALEHDLAQAGFEDYVPQVCGVVIIFKARKR
jgi:SAM-dependent methyltransferase